MAAGAAGAVVLADGVASGSSRPGARAGEVVRVGGAMAEVALDGGGVVTVPTAGFPSGWRLRPGDAVMVLSSEAHGGPDRAEPLVTSITGRLGHERGRRVQIGGKSVRVLRQTIQTGQKTAAGTRAEAFCIRNRRENSLTAVAIRVRD